MACVSSERRPSAGFSADKSYWTPPAHVYVQAEVSSSLHVDILAEDSGKADAHQGAQVLVALNVKLGELGVILLM